MASSIEAVVVPAVGERIKSVVISPAGLQSSRSWRLSRDGMAVVSCLAFGVSRGFGTEERGQNRGTIQSFNFFRVVIKVGRVVPQQTMLLLKDLSATME